MSRSLDHHFRDYARAHHQNGAPIIEDAVQGAVGEDALSAWDNQEPLDLASTGRPSRPLPLRVDFQPAGSKYFRVDDTDRPAVRRARGRLYFGAAVYLVGCVVIALRLMNLAMFPDENVGQNHLASKAHGGLVRADIVDRNGVLLATQLRTASMYADPHSIQDPEDVADKLLTVMPNLDRERLVSQLTSDRRFIWLKRNISPAEQAAIFKMGIPGVHFQTEERRIYPQGNLTSHIIGATNIDNQGLAGIEKTQDDDLKTRRDPLKLTLDIRLQHVMRRELAAQVVKHRALGAAGMIMDVKTGEILSMVSLPDYDPTNIGAASEEARFNRNTLGVYEMGSTFKIFTTALALDKNVVGFSDGYDARQPIKVGRFTISDFHPENRWLSVPEIFMYSSNIGTVHMAMATGREQQQAFMNALGMTHRASVELPDRGDPLVPNPWRDVNMMTVSYGHGMAVSPLHLMRGVAAMVNGGTLPQPTLVKREGAEIEPGQRVISEKTSKLMRKLLRLVVVGGTGSKAEVPGYYVGGKTGTAEKAKNGRYAEKALMSSFVGAFPMQNPRYVLMVMMDEPKGDASTYGYATGGWVSAPVVSRVIQEMATLYGIPPADLDDPHIQNALAIQLPQKEKGPTLASFGTDH